MVVHRVRSGWLVACVLLSCAHPAREAAVKALPSPAIPADPFAQTVNWRAEELAPPKGMWLRVKSPATALPRILKIAKDPWLRGFADIRAIAGLLLGHELTGLIDFDAPMDVLMRRRSEDSGIVVAGHFVNDAGFRPDKLGLELLPVSPGRWQIRPSHYAGTLRCELWHAPAPIGYRILCGDAADELARAASFLLGRLARQPLTSDARAVSSDYPLADRFRDRTGGAQKVDSNEKSAQNDPAEDFVPSFAKAESIAFDLNFLEQDIELGVELSFLAPDTSAAFRSWLGAPQPLPRQFWQVLDFAPVTVAFTGTDEHTAQQLLDDEAGLLRPLLELDDAAGVTPALRDRVLQAMGGLIPERLRFTVSSGGSGSVVRTASNSAALAAKRTATPLRGARWLLLGLAGAGERYQAGLDVLFDASQAKSATKASSGASTKPSFVRIRERPAGLPAESTLFRVGSGNDPCFGWVLPTADWICSRHRANRR
jgi:hypothetical protein